MGLSGLKDDNVHVTEGVIASIVDYMLSHYDPQRAAAREAQATARGWRLAPRARLAAVAALPGSSPARPGRGEQREAVAWLLRQGGRQARWRP